MNRLLTALRNYRNALLPVSGAVFLNLPLLLAIFWRNQPGTSPTALNTLYLTGVALGYYLLPLLIVLVVASLTALFSRRGALILAVVLLGAFIFYMLADSIVFGIYKFHIDLFWMDFVVHNAGGMGISAGMMLKAAAVLAVVMALEFGLIRLAGHWLHRARFVWLMVALSLVLFAASQVMHILAYEKDDSRITALTPGLPFYMPFTSHKHAVRYGDKVPLFADEEGGAPDGSSGSAHGAFHYPLNPPRLAPVPRDSLPNILLLVLESWRADEMNERVCPRIRDLGTRSTVCRNHFSSGNSTVAGIFGLFYGIEPTYWDEVKANSEAIHNPVLIDILQDRGYGLGIFARSKFRRHKIKDTVFRGIEVHEDFAGKTFAAQDRDLTDQLLAFIDRQDRAGQPFMALAFFKASHFDYSCDKEHAIFQPAKKLNMAVADRIKDMTPYLNRYRNAVHFDDVQIGRILDDLQRRGMMDNTIIVVTSDHAEEFNDSGDNYWGHGSNFTRYQTQVPFILYLPGRGPRVLDEVTSHLDLVPTLVKNYLGCTNPITDYSDGLDLLGPLPAQRALIIASYYNHAVVLGDDVYASCPMQVRKYKVYDSTLKAGPPSMDLMREALADMARFYRNSGSPKIPAAETATVKSRPGPLPHADADAAP